MPYSYMYIHHTMVLYYIYIYILTTCVYNINQSSVTFPYYAPFVRVVRSYIHIAHAGVDVPATIRLLSVKINAVRILRHIIIRYIIIIIITNVEGEKKIWNNELYIIYIIPKLRPRRRQLDVCPTCIRRRPQSLRWISITTLAFYGYIMTYGHVRVSRVYYRAGGGEQQVIFDR